MGSLEYPSLTSRISLDKTSKGRTRAPEIRMEAMKTTISMRICSRRAFLLNISLVCWIYSVEVLAIRTPLTVLAWVL